MKKKTEIKMRWEDIQNELPKEDSVAISCAIAAMVEAFYELKKITVEKPHLVNSEDVEYLYEILSEISEWVMSLE